ncbi:MAG: D-alanine--D-alanine ligase [Planctomycetes bacterium]|nr:D-alanine--D-alanine ligase [Planctomycetota bacterium]
MRRLRIIVMMHAELVPPETTEGLSESEIHAWKAEYDVLSTLERLGHDVLGVGMEDDFAPLRRAIREHRPHIVFNLLTHFHEAGIYDSAVVGWLELNKLAYTGCNPRGLLVANDKALGKKVLSYHRIRAPRFFSVPRGRRATKLPGRLEFPLIVKSASEHASTGISQASVVRSLDQLAERVEFVHRNVGTAALCEEYIQGRELTIGVLGNNRLETGPVWELAMPNLPEGKPNIVTSRVKWDLDYQAEVGLKTFPARDLGPAREAEIERLARRIYRAMGLSGYARIDMRMDDQDRIWVLEANPNPDLCFGEDFAESFERRGYDYPQLLQKLVNLGLRYVPPWKG